MGDGDVLCAVARIDAVRVAGIAFGRVDLHAPYTFAVVVVDMGVVSDAIQREVVGRVGFNETRDLNGP